MVLYFTSNQITIRRQRHKSGLRYGLSATGTVHGIDLQPVEADRVNLLDGIIGKTYEGWLESTVDVKESDQIKLTDTGKIFSVKSVSTYEGAGLLDHHYLILISQD